MAALRENEEVVEERLRVAFEQRWRISGSAKHLIESRGDGLFVGGLAAGLLLLLTGLVWGLLEDRLILILYGFLMGLGAVALSFLLGVYRLGRPLSPDRARAFAEKKDLLARLESSVAMLQKEKASIDRKIASTLREAHNRGVDPHAL